MSPERRLRLAVLLEASGLFLEGISLLSLGPGTFTLFALMGAPLIVAGMVLFGIHVVKDLASSGAL